MYEISIWIKKRKEKNSHGFDFFTQKFDDIE